MSTATPTVVLALLGAGVLAGFINAIAGGGALLTLPVLMLCGLPPTVANGSLRISILTQGLAAAWRFRAAGAIDVPALRRHLVPVLAGAVGGIALGIGVGDSSYRRMIGVLGLVVGAMVALEPWLFAGRGTRSTEARRSRLMPWAMLAAGFYGGLVQAGVGYLLLGALVYLERQTLAAANVTKNVLVLAYAPLAVAGYLAAGKVDLLAALLLAAGAAVGGWLGAAAAVNHGARIIRPALAVVLVLAALDLLGIDLVAAL